MPALLFMASALPSFAQDSLCTKCTDKQLFNHLSVGLNIGTPGFGIDLATPITPYLAVRAGVNIFPVVKWHDSFYLESSMSDYNSFCSAHPEMNLPESKLTGYDDVDYEASTHNTTGHVLFDVYPGKHSTFHITLGAYFGASEVIKLKNREPGIFKGVSTYNNYVEQHPEAGYEKIGVWFDDNYFLEPDDDGNVNGAIKVSGFRPYVGIGVGRAIPKHRMGFQFDFGAQFWGKPKVYCQGQEVSKQSEDGYDDEDGDFMKIAKKIVAYPVINFRIVGRII